MPWPHKNTKPWERQPDEKTSPYEAALAYFAMGPSRTHAAVAEKFKKSTTLIGRWASNFDWKERAQAYDEHIAAVEQKARDKAAAKEAALWETRRARIRSQEWQVSKALREKAVGMLAHPLTEEFRESDDGPLIVRPARWTMKDAAILAKVAADLARQAAAMPADESQETEAELTPEEQLVVYKALHAFREGRAEGRTG